MANRPIPLMIATIVLGVAGFSPASPGRVTPEVTSCNCASTVPVVIDQVTSQTGSFESGVLGRLQKLAAKHRGRFGLSARNLDTGETLEVNAESAFPTASTIKLAVMVAAMDQLGRPGSPVQTYFDKIALDPETSASGAGLLQNYRPGIEVEFKELIHLMITVSDNQGTNQIVKWFGGLDFVNRWLDSHGFRVTRMNATIGGRMVGDPLLRSTWGIGVTTPCEMRRLMEMIVLGQAGSTSGSEEMLRVLGNQYFDDLIAATVPPTVWVGSKSGALNRSRSDVAVVSSPGGRYVVAVFTANNEDVSWTASNEGEVVIREAGKILWEHFNPAQPYQPPSGQEKF